MWKQCAFLDLQKDLAETRVLNLISVDDSVLGIDAAFILSQKFEQSFVKTIAFK